MRRTCRAHVARATSNPRMIAADGFCSDSCRLHAKTERVAELEAGLEILIVAIRRGTPNEPLISLIEAMLD